MAADSKRLANTNGTLNFHATLPWVDAHRVAAAVEKAVERLQLLTLLNYESPNETAATPAPQPQAGLKSTGGVSGATSGGGDRGVGNLLEDQKRLESRYEQLLVATKKVKPDPLHPTLDPLCFAHVDNAERRAQLTELQRIAAMLKEQSKQLCRQLRENPNDADNWKKIVSERSDLIHSLAGLVRELTSATASAGSRSDGPLSASYEQFAKKILDEQSAQQWADEIVKKEKEINQNVKQLQTEVKQERLQKERELEECHRKLTDLKTELRNLRRDVKERSDKVRAETEASSEAFQRSAMQQQRGLRSDINASRDAVQNEHQVHDLILQHIGERIKRLDDIAAKWDQKNQDEIKKMEARKVDVEQSRRECAEKLKEKSELRLQAFEQQKIRREEAALDEQEHTETLNRAQAEYAAATKLEAALKGFFTRQALISLKKKAGKKKK